MTISEICEKYGLTKDTLRYYEKIGLLPKIGRNTIGFREYSEIDCQRISLIKHMRSSGMSIKKLTMYISITRSGAESVADRKNILLEQRHLLSAQIDELQATLLHLDEKIESYETHVASREMELFIL